MQRDAKDVEENLQKKEPLTILPQHSQIEVRKLLCLAMKNLINLSEKSKSGLLFNR